MPRHIKAEYYIVKVRIRSKIKKKRKICKNVEVLKLKFIKKIGANRQFLKIILNVEAYLE